MPTLRIAEMLLRVTVDDDVARAAGVPAEAEEVSFTRARVLLEAQWLKNQKNLAAHRGPSPGSAGAINKQQDIDKTKATTMKTILMNETDGQGSDNGEGTKTDTAPPAAAGTQAGAQAGDEQQSEEAAADKGTPAEDNADANGKATV